MFLNSLRRNIDLGIQHGGGCDVFLDEKRRRALETRRR
jgi:hypothetical protein